MHPSRSISIALANIKVLIDISHSHAPVVSYDAHETLAHVADLVVVVQELDVGFDDCLGIFVSKSKHRWVRKTAQERKKEKGRAVRSGS